MSDGAHDGPAVPAPDPPSEPGGDSTPVPHAGPAGPGPAATPPGPAPRSRRGRRAARPHPYANEASTPRELSHDPRRVTMFWFGLATLLVVAGLAIATRLSPVLGNGVATPGRDPFESYRQFSSCLAEASFMACGPSGWQFLTEVPLFAGLAMLGFGFLDRPWARRVALVGWLLFGFYWALVAQDLLIEENQDYVNFAFALAGTYFFTYLSYHMWLSEVRGVTSRTVRFLNVSTFWAAGAYFLIDKIQVIRTWLILSVSRQTETMLGWFGQGPDKGLVYLTDLGDPEAPTNFFYTPHFCDPNHYDVQRGMLTKAAEYCRDHGLNVPVHDAAIPPGSWASILHFQPDGNHLIIPVSVILACTALQSIMLFVGLFLGTQAPWRKRITASLVVGLVVYVLNLVRNTGIIWFYGQGITSFWIIHDAIGKGGSLLAMVGIAFGTFAYFPEFLEELVGVLDLPHRDGPVERTLRIGRRRPAAAPAG